MGIKQVPHLTTLGNTTRHGYTGHAMLDGVGRIHMRGRVYDPRIGRLLSRDPYIDGVAGSQGVNGYAYVQHKIAGSDLEQPRGWPRRGEGRDSLSTQPAQPLGSDGI